MTHKSYTPSPKSYRRNAISSSITEGYRNELELLSKKLGVSVSSLVSMGVVHMLNRYKNNTAYADIVNKEVKSKSNE